MSKGFKKFIQDKNLESYIGHLIEEKLCVDRGNYYTDLLNKTVQIHTYMFNEHIVYTVPVKQLIKTLEQRLYGRNIDILQKLATTINYRR